MHAVHANGSRLWVRYIVSPLRNGVCMLPRPPIGSADYCAIFSGWHRLDARLVLVGLRHFLVVYASGMAPKSVHKRHATPSLDLGNVFCRITAMESLSLLAGKGQDVIGSCMNACFRYRHD